MPAAIELSALSALPQRMGAFERRGETEPDRSPVQSGAIQRLVAQDATATVYLFSWGGRPVRDGVDAPEVERELADSTQVMVSSSMAVVGSRAAPRPISVNGSRQGGPTDMRCFAVAYPGPQAARREAVCVAGVLGRLLKLRMTILIRTPNARADIAAMAVGTGALALAMDVQQRLRSGGAPGTRASIQSGQDVNG